MCFEKTVMTSREFGLINHRVVSGPVREGMQMWQALGTMGEILLSEIQDEDFCVWHIEYNIKEDVILTLQQEPPTASVGLSFSLKKNIPYLIINAVECFCPDLVIYLFIRNRPLSGQEVFCQKINSNIRYFHFLRQRFDELIEILIFKLCL